MSSLPTGESLMLWHVCEGVDLSKAVNKARLEINAISKRQSDIAEENRLRLEVLAGGLKENSEMLDKFGNSVNERLASRYTSTGKRHPGRCNENGKTF
jgi:hypothetical protein